MNNSRKLNKLLVNKLMFENTLLNCNRFNNYLPIHHSTNLKSTKKIFDIYKGWLLANGMYNLRNKLKSYILTFSARKLCCFPRFIQNITIISYLKKENLSLEKEFSFIF